VRYVRLETALYVGGYGIQSADARRCTDCPRTFAFEKAKAYVIINSPVDI